MLKSTRRQFLKGTAGVAAAAAVPVAAAQSKPSLAESELTEAVWAEAMDEVNHPSFFVMSTATNGHTGYVSWDGTEWVKCA